MNTIKIMDEVRLVNTVCEQTTTYTARVPEHEARARRIAAEAATWLAFATEHTQMKSDVLLGKALSSACFAVAAGAAAFVVPSKLSSVRERQNDLWALVRSGYDRYTELGFDTATTEGVRVTIDDEPIGEVQDKHVLWVRPIVRFGLSVCLSRITGTETRGYTLGANVIYAGVGRAITARAEALGNEPSSGDGASGNCLATVAAAVFPVPALPSRKATATSSGDGSTSGDGASVRLAAMPVPDPADIVLYRSVDGTARATVVHVVRHSPSGLEWGYGGSGPADLARSVLLALTDEATAERLYQVFKAEVVARVPFAGGVLRAARIRAWVDRQDAAPLA